MVHFISAALLFGILAYFCLVFYRKTRAGSAKQRRRAVVYLLWV